MNIIKALAAILCIGIASCKKPKDATPPSVPTENEPTYDNYSALKAGNYWVYQRYIFNANTDSSAPQNQFDSCYIEKDTLINGKTYFKHCTRSYYAPQDISVSFLRDSLSYIVNSSGSILFSSEDFSTIFYEAAFGPNGATPDSMRVSRRMASGSGSITVPAGTFNALAHVTTYHYPENDPRIDVVLNRWYAKDIGMVLDNEFFYSAQPHIRHQQRLVRFHIE